MAVKTLQELMEPFLKPYSGSYNDRMFAWLSAGAPGWLDVIDPDNNGTPGGPATGGGGNGPFPFEATVHALADGVWAPRPDIDDPVFFYGLHYVNLSLPLDMRPGDGILTIEPLVM